MNKSFKKEELNKKTKDELIELLNISMNMNNNYKLKLDDIKHKIEQEINFADGLGNSNIKNSDKWDFVSAELQVFYKQLYKMDCKLNDNNVSVIGINN